MNSTKSRTSATKQPKQERSKNLVQSIFIAAARILEKQGFDKSTTNRIAELAGVSIGSLYQYFPSKEALVGNLIDSQITQNLDVIRKKMLEVQSQDPPLDLRGAIHFLISEVVDLILEKKGFFQNLFVEALRLNRVEPLVKAREEGARLFQETLERYSSGLRAVDLKTLSFICTNAVMGVLQISALQCDTSVDRETLKKELSILVMNYLAPPPSR